MPTPSASRHVEYDELLNQESVAKIINTTTKFLEARRCRGGGPPFIRVGRLVRYRRSDLDEWIESKRMESTSGRK